MRSVDLHRAILNIAISNGARLIEQIRGTKADISLSGHDLATLEASLELLRVTEPIIPIVRPQN
jgi:hypothetical protein